MLEEDEQEEFKLQRKLQQYKKINFNLRRKLKDKDIKIHKLFGLIENTGKKLQFTPQPSKNTKGYLSDNAVKLSLSENKKRQKQNKHSPNAEQNNIFKDINSNYLDKRRLLGIRLPIMGNKMKSQSCIVDGNEKHKQKIVRIALDKLRPLQAGEVERRFLLKYKKRQISQL